MKTFAALSMAATASNAIDTKTKELIALAIGIVAHQHGATRQEVLETVALAVYTGGATAAAYGGDAVRAYDQFSGPQQHQRYHD